MSPMSRQVLRAVFILIRILVLALTLLLSGSTPAL